MLYLAPPLRGGVDSVTGALTGRLVFADGLAYKLQLVMLIMFVGVLAISWIERRLWCRHLCPLGALLGLIGRKAIYGRVVDDRACALCEACVAACPMDAVRDGGRSTDCSRCSWAWSAPTPVRRAPSAGAAGPANSTCTTPAGGLCSRRAAWPFVGGFFLYTGLGRIQRNVYLIRPPGARQRAATSWPPAPAAPSA